MGIEVQRGVDWVSEDQARYWPLQGRRAEEQLATARTELELCQSASLKDEKRSCYQERKHLEQAIARLRHCEAQVRVVKHWKHLVAHEAEEFRGRISRLVYYLDTVVPQALAALDRMIAALEKYAESPRPSPPPST